MPLHMCLYHTDRSFRAFYPTHSVAIKQINDSLNMLFPRLRDFYIFHKQLNGGKFFDMFWSIIPHIIALEG